MKLLIALSLILITAAMHALGMLAAFGVLRMDRLQQVLKRLHLQLLQLGLILVILIVTTLFEGVLWAVVYLWLTEITELQTFEAAFYFSMVTYTTLGYGDIYLQSDWRLISACQAACGIVMFGWTTSIFMVSLQRLFFPDKNISAPRR